jgi:hypothetical protein
MPIKYIMPIKYNIDPLISDELVKEHCCKVFVNAITGESAYDQTDTTIEGQKYYYKNPSAYIPPEAIYGGLNVINRCAIDINKQFINQSGSVEWCDDGVYSKGASVKHTTTNNVIYYISQKDENTDALTAPSWKIDNTAFDFTDFTCNNSASNIKLTHKGQMKFVSDYLHNGLHIVFIANKTNTSAISSIEIDGVSVGLCDNNDKDITPTQIQKDTIIELFYSEAFEKFVYFPKNNKISGEFFTTAQKSTKISGCVPCLGQELDKEVYATLWKMLGIGGRNETDTTSGVCYTGASVYYIDLEETKAIGNDYFSTPTPARQKQLKSTKAYRLVLNGNTYQVDSEDATKYININNEADIIYFNSTTIAVGTKAYDKHQPAVYKTITGRNITKIYFNSIEYTQDTTELSCRKFLNGSLVVWVYSDNKDIQDGDYLYQGATDPRTIYCNFNVSAVGTGTITANGFTYNQNASDNKRWDWNNEGSEAPEYETIYTEQAEVGIGDKVFFSAVNVNRITDYYVYTINSDNSTSQDNTYQNTSEDPNNDFAQLSTGTLFYVDSSKPEIGGNLYAEQIQKEVGEVSELINSYITNDNLEAIPNGNDKQFTINDIIYYTKLSKPNINDWLYLSVYPAPQGQYTAFTDTTITIDGTIYNEDTEIQGRYIGSGDALFYIRREDIYTIDDNVMDKDGNIIAEYLYSDKYCTQQVGMVKTLTDTSLTLQNGDTYTRYKAGDEGTTFRIPDLRGGIPFGANNVNELMVLSNGKIPNLKGQLKCIQTNGFTYYNASNVGTGIFKTSYAGSALQGGINASVNISLDASTISDVYTDDYNKVSPAGFGTIWFIQM